MTARLAPHWHALDYADEKLGSAVLHYLTTNKPLRERLEEAADEVIAAGLFADELPADLRRQLTVVRVRLQGAGDVGAHLRAISDPEVCAIGRLLVSLYLAVNSARLLETVKETRRLCEKRSDHR